MLKVLKCVTENTHHGHLNIFLVLYINIMGVKICMYIKDNKWRIIEIHFTGNVNVLQKIILIDMIDSMMVYL